MPILEANHLSKKHVSKRLFSTARSVQALDDVTFSLERRQCLGIVGESGCGKSTLCRILCGIELPDSGFVALDGKKIGPGKDGDWRPRIQMVFQDSLDAVDPRYTAADILSEPLESFTNLRGEAKMERMRALMQQVGLPPEDLQKKGRHFSGGQLQRICIARALAAKPDVILLDEPLSSLDVSVQAQVLNLLRSIKEETGVSYVIISHDMEAIYYLADALVVMYAGQIVETLPDIQQIRTLCHPYSRHLLLPFEARGEIENTGMTADGFATEHSGCPYVPRCPVANEACKTEKIPFREVLPGHFVCCRNDLRMDEAIL